MVRRVGWVALIGFLSVAAAVEAADPSLDLRTFTLENGLQVLLLPQPAAQMVASVVVVHSGLRDEPADLNGVSHFLEHLLFNGTERRTQKQLYDDVDAIGGYNNAHTALDRTTFMMLAPSSAIERALDIQSDMLFHSILPREKLEKERGIVLREIDKDRDSPDSGTERVFRSLLLSGTPYARPILGPRRLIETIRREKVLEFYRQHYAPNNMTLLLIGGFEVDSALALVSHYFGNEVPRQVPPPLESRLRPLRRDVLLRTSTAGSQRSLRFGTVGPAVTLPVAVVREVGVQLLNSSASSWSLLAALRSEFGQAVQSATVSFGFHPDLSYLTATVKYGGDVAAEALFRFCCSWLRNLGSVGVDGHELEAAKLQLEAQDVLNLERPHFWGMLKAPYLVSFGPAGLTDYGDALRQLSAVSLQSEWADWLARAHFLGLAAEPQAEIAGGQGTGSLPAPRLWTLPSGLTLIAIQDPSSRVFAATLLARARLAREPEGKEGMADLLHRLMARSTRTHPDGGMAAELERAGLEVQVTDMPWIPYDDYYTQPDFSFIRVEGLARYGQRALELLAEMITQPNLTESELEVVRREALGALAARNVSARGRSSRLFWRELFRKHPFARPVFGTRESLASVTVDDLRAFAKEYLSPDNLVLAVVGPSDPEEIRVEVQRLLSNYSAQAAEGSRWDGPPEPLRGLKKVEERRGSGRAYLRLGNLLTSVADEDVPALLVAAQVLSGRLAFDLREQRGWAYSIGFGVELFGSWGLYQAWMNLAAENLEEATDAMRQHIRRLQQAGCGPEELERAVNQVRSRYAMRLLRSVNRAFYAAQDWHRTGDPEWTNHWLEELSGVDGAAVKRVASRYLSADDLLIVWVD